MYQREFENLLQTTLPRAILFYGENDYLVSTYIQHYINRTNSSESLLTLYFEEYHFEKAKAYLSQSSLFGGTNLLVIKREKKIPKKELDTLIELVNKNSDNYLLFNHQGNATDSKTLQNSFSPKNGANWVRLFEPNIKESLAMLQKKAQHIGLKIDHYALQHLMLLLNNNIALCANELNKLALLKGEVTSKDIDRLVYSTAPLAVEQLLIELFEKKPVVITVSKLLELGEDEFSLLRSTQFFINQIFLFNAYMKLHGHIDSKAILGYQLPKQIEEQKANLALKVKSPAILKIFEHLLEVELQLKNTPATNRELLLYGAFIKLQSYL
ncbi:MAG: DNA polymerase III subunit delta [Sulfurovum sp. FS06-10]|jgi:DNA polymerase-3 subunit delta|nr:MAG: DNA polymerase III subunit delta [Sulfurovum sp. FS06-10]